jgi:hypothetical protein
VSVRGRGTRELRQAFGPFSSLPNRDRHAARRLRARRRKRQPTQRGGFGRAVSVLLPASLLTFARSVYVAFVVARSSLVTR